MLDKETNGDNSERKSQIIKLAILANNLASLQYIFPDFNFSTPRESYLEVRHLIGNLFNVLPQQVSVITVNTQYYRDPLNPDLSGENWTILDVETYAFNFSRQIGVPWNPIFKHDTPLAEN